MNAAQVDSYSSEDSVHSPGNTSDLSQLALTIEQAAKRLGIGRTLMYSLVKSGEIESVSIGRLRRIPVECLAEYVANLRSKTQLAA